MITYKTFKSFELLSYLQDELEVKINDLSNRLKFLSYNSLCESNGQENFFFTAFENNKLIGILKLKTKGNDSLRFPNYYNWLSLCSVDENYKHQGISKKLLNMLFEFLKNNELNHLLSSGYTESGFLYLEPQLVKLSAKYNIDFKDRKEITK
jgi:hypothetical protein